MRWGAGLDALAAPEVVPEGQGQIVPYIIYYIYYILYMIKWGAGLDALAALEVVPEGQGHGALVGGLPALVERALHQLRFGPFY